MNDNPSMDDPAFRTAYLIARFVDETMNQAEENELDNWMNASFENQVLFEKMVDLASKQGFIRNLNCKLHKTEVLYLKFSIIFSKISA